MGENVNFCFLFFFFFFSISYLYLYRCRSNYTGSLYEGNPILSASRRYLRYLTYFINPPVNHLLIFYGRICIAQHIVCRSENTMAIEYPFNNIAVDAWYICKVFGRICAAMQPK